MSTARFLARKFNLDPSYTTGKLVNNQNIWNATDALKNLLPKPRPVNSYVKTNDHQGELLNAITDLSFRPHALSPERLRRVWKGINLPIIVPQSPNISDRALFYGDIQPWLSTRNSIIAPFVSVKGTIKRDFLSLDSVLLQVEKLFSLRKEKYLSIVSQINNLTTYYPDNETQDYAEGIIFFQGRADHLDQCLITLSTMRSEIAQNLIDIDAYLESDLDLDNQYYAHYRQIRDSLTYTNFDYYLPTTSGINNNLLEQLAELFDVQNTTYKDGYFPLRTDGSISYSSNNIPYQALPQGTTNTKYYALGSLYDEKFVDPSLHIKGTPLNEETESIRTKTNGPVLATQCNVANVINGDYFVRTTSSFQRSFGRYNSIYVDSESINDHSNLTSPYVDYEDTYGDDFFDSMLTSGVINPQYDDVINPPKILNIELAYNPAPKVVLLFTEDNENDTFVAGATMLTRKSVEVDFISYGPNGTLNDDRNSSIYVRYNFEEPWNEIPREYRNDNYTIQIHPLPPNEYVKYIRDELTDYRLDGRFREDFTVGNSSTLIGNSLTLNYNSSFKYEHNVELLERLPRPAINTAGRTSKYDSSTGINTFFIDIRNYNFADPFYDDNYCGGNLHSHGRYHPNKGLYDLEDLFVSASHLGDRYNKEKWNLYSGELDKEAPLVVYRRGYSVLDHINLHLDYGNESSVTQNGNPGDNWGYSVTIIDFDEDTWDITNVYDSTSDIIWHGRNPDSPVEEPFLWLYKGQHRRKYVSLYESYRYNGTLRQRSYVNKESIQNIYFYHKGYIVGPHPETTGTFSSDFDHQVDELKHYGAGLQWTIGGVETLYAKNEGENVYYDSYGNETYRDTFDTYEDTFDETPVEDIVDRIKAGNTFPPIWGDQGDNYDYSYSNNPFGNKFFEGHNYPWTDDYWDKGILVEGTSDNLHLYFLEKDNTKHTVCNIKFEIDTPLT